MRTMRAALAVVVLVSAACGAQKGGEPTTTSTVPGTTSTTSTPTTLPGSTTTTPTTVPVGDGPVLGPVPTVSGLLDARHAADIPWESTAGHGWLLFGFRPESESPWEGPHVLYLIDGSNAVYEVGAWHGFWPLVEDWSAVGRSVLVVDEDGLWLVDLVSGAPTFLMDPPFEDLAARFVAPDDDLIAVRTTTYDDGLRRARLDLVSLTGVWVATLSDTTFDESLDPASVPQGVSWVALPDGSGIVLSDAAGIRLVDRSGATVRLYDAPGLGCAVVRGWGAAVLVSCVHPDYVASGCFSLWGRDGYSGLWSMPIGGSPAEEIHVPLQPPGGDDCWAGAYVDAVPLSESSPKVLLELGGCCECGGSLALIDGAGGPVSLTPTGGQTCWPDVLCARGSGWLVADYGPSNALFVIEPDGSYTDLIPRVDFGGVTGAWRADDYSFFG